MADVDGIRLDLFEVGFEYEVGYSVAALLLAEGWAAPAADDGDGMPFANGSGGRADDASV